MNALTLSPEAQALSKKPPGVETIRITGRDQWLKLRENDVTASVAAAVLGVNPWTTYWGLWMLKAGRMSADEVASDPIISADGDEIILPPAARGHAREGEAIELVKVLRPSWTISYPLNYYWRDREKRIGATPDALAYDPSRPGFGVIQVKTVAPTVYDNEWKHSTTGVIEPPIWIIIQAIIEAKLTGASWAVVAVHRELYGARPSMRLVDVPLHDKLWNRLLIDVPEFWRTIEAGTEPSPDYRRDSEGIMRLYREAIDGDVVDLVGEKAERAAVLLDEHARLKTIMKAGKDAEDEIRIVRGELVHMLGNSSVGNMPDGRVIRIPSQKRRTIDSDHVLRDMGPSWVAAHTKTTTFRVVKIQGEPT